MQGVAEMAVEEKLRWAVWKQRGQERVYAPSVGFQQEGINTRQATRVHEEGNV